MAEKETVEQKIAEASNEARQAKHNAKLDEMVKSGKARSRAHAEFKIRGGAI